MFQACSSLGSCLSTIDIRFGVVCGSIEHKMGIKASATCVMNFDAAKGVLIGEPNKG